MPGPEPKKRECVDRGESRYIKLSRHKDTHMEVIECNMMKTKRRKCCEKRKINSDRWHSCKLKRITFK